MNGIGQAVDYIDSGLRQFPEGALRPILIALLGFTFMWSAIAKTRSPWRTAFALVDFGLVRQPHVLLVWMVIVGEIGLAALLLTAPAVSSGLVLFATSLAAGTLSLFTILIARALRSGKRFACACFGDGDNEDMSRSTLARSTGLTLLTAGCGVSGPLGAPLNLGELALTWCAAAGALGIAVMASRLRRLAQLPRPCWDGAA